ncbi:MAG TPA: hypothetical protein VFT91_10425 [Dehalococcoidia bacterium]|nr:hypothetical protein [Dehalococcoidia bacterium]
MAGNQEAELEEVQEALAETQAQLEALQAQAADAEARAATLRGDLSDSRGEVEGARAELAEAQGARDAAQAEAASLQGQLAEARSELKEAAMKYREARLAAAPQVPADLVPGAEELAEIDRQFEAAERVVEQLREKLEGQKQASRVPVGAPARRPADLSGLSAAEKIKLGLRERDRR